MRKILYVVVSLVAFGMTIWSCDDYEDYSELRDYELSAVSRFVDNPSFGEIMGKKINVISEKEFLKDTITDVSKNEFVLFENGVYMQIVRRGCGSVLKNGEKAAVLCRYKEYNINERNDSAVLVSFNDDPVKYQSLYDKIDVVNNSGTFKKSWSLTEDNTGYQSRLYAYYASKYKTSISVPEGWLVPLSYIKLGRPQKDGDEIAKVRLIVPHEMGHEVALNRVCAFYYEITYERGI
jgi:hypothetical protein